MRQRWSSPWISSGVIRHDFLECIVLKHLKHAESPWFSHVFSRFSQIFVDPKPSLTFGRRWADRMWNWSLRSLKEDEAADE